MRQIWGVGGLETKNQKLESPAYGVLDRQEMSSFITAWPFKFVKNEFTSWRVEFTIRNPERWREQQRDGRLCPMPSKNGSPIHTPVTDHAMGNLWWVYGHTSESRVKLELLVWCCKRAPELHNQHGFGNARTPITTWGWGWGRGTSMMSKSDGHYSICKAAICQGVCINTRYNLLCAILLYVTESLNINF